MAQQDQDRTEPATPHKLEEARKRGAVAKSTDVVSVVVLVAALLYWTLGGSGFGRHGAELAQRLLASAGGIPLDVPMAVALGRQVMRAVAQDLFLALAVVAAAAAIAMLAQVGPKVSFIPLKPDLQRINPVEGMKRLWSLRVLIEALKTLVKAVLLTAVLGAGLWAGAERLFFSGAGTSPAYWRLVAGELTGLAWMLVGALLLAALADWTLVRWELGRRLRMSRRELREELRRREGDPRIKQRLRQLRVEALKRARGLSRVKRSDVLLVNPTHVAVALKYDRGCDDTPTVIAKGAGELAAAMRQEARKHGVPVFQNVKLARALYRKTAIDGPVAPELFPEVAQMLVWAFRLRGAQGRHG